MYHFRVISNGVPRLFMVKAKTRKDAYLCLKLRYPGALISYHGKYQAEIIEAKQQQ